MIGVGGMCQLVIIRMQHALAPLFLIVIFEDILHALVRSIVMEDVPERHLGAPFVWD